MTRPRNAGKARCALIILDGVGIGAAPDAADYDDEGSDTLGNLARAVGGFDLPNLERLGLGCCRPLEGMRCGEASAVHGVAVPRGKGKDSTSGHWELCGLVLEQPFPTYPNGFPSEIVDAFSRGTGRPVLGNCVASGTAIIDQLGAKQLESGAWILYTSADSVFQIAAHEELIPLAELEHAAQVARGILTGQHAVSRVIIRPFVGEPGRFRRTANRRDYAVPPPAATLLDRLSDAGVPRRGIGKVDDLFAGRGISSRHTASNPEAYRLIMEELDTMESGLLFANVLEFDQTWGHRNDVPGFYQGLKDLDAVIPALLGLLRAGDLMILTADHGNDPTTPSTDHSRETVPLLVAGPEVHAGPLGDVAFVDVGATVAEFFGVSLGGGRSFLSDVWGMRSRSDG